MVNRPYLSFLQNRINEIGSALLFSQSKSVLNLPVTIVQAILVDDLGFIWLAAPRPKQDIREFEQQFPARLCFFKKGTAFYLTVEGRAQIILEPAEKEEMLRALDTAGQAYAARYCFIKTEITHAEYHEMLAPGQRTALEYILSQLTHWLFPQAGANRYKPAAFQPALRE